MLKCTFCSQWLRKQKSFPALPLGPWKLCRHLMWRPKPCVPVCMRCPHTEKSLWHGSVHGSQLIPALLIFTSQYSVEGSRVFADVHIAGLSGDSKTAFWFHAESLIVCELCLMFHHGHNAVVLLVLHTFTHSGYEIWRSVGWEDTCSKIPLGVSKLPSSGVCRSVFVNNTVALSASAPGCCNS